MPTSAAATAPQVQPTVNPTPATPSPTVSTPAVQQAPAMAAPIPAAPNDIPAINSVYSDQSAPGITFGVWAIVCAFFLPLVGVIFSIIAMVKGFKKPFGNTKLGTLGAIGLPLNIITGVVIAVLAFNWLFGLVTYDELVSYSETYNGTSGQYSYSFSYPKQFTNSTSTLPNNAVFLAHLIADDATQQDAAISGALLIIEEVAGATFFDVAELTTDSSRIALSQLIDRMLTVRNTQITNINTSFVSQVGTAAVLDFTTSNPSNEFTGQYLLAYDASTQALYNFMVFAESSIWELNENVWGQMLNSLTTSELPAQG